MVVNVELSIRLECHGVSAALRSLPGLAGAVLRLRRSGSLGSLSSAPRERDQNAQDWHALASRMDTELDHIGAARLLRSHTPHESCLRTSPTQARPIWSVTLVPLRSTAIFTGVPLIASIDLPMEQPGAYEMQIALDDTPSATVPLHVREALPPFTPPGGLVS